MSRPIVCKQRVLSSVVVAARHDLLAGGPQQDGVLELRGVAAAYVAQRRVRVHHALVAQVLERHGVARRARALQPALAERERAELLIDRVQQLLRRLQSVDGNRKMV